MNGGDTQRRIADDFLNVLMDQSQKIKFKKNGK